MFVLFFILSGCGAKSPNQRVSKDFYEKEIQFLLLEKQCQSPQGRLSPLTIEINQLYADMVKTKPLAFLFVPSKLFDYQAPLKISHISLQKELEEIRGKLNAGSVEEITIAHKLFHAYQNANRFESLKCSLDTLALKKKNDLIPMKNLEEFCLSKSSSALCTDQVIAQLSPTEEDFVKASTIELCRSFSKDVNCQTEWIMNERSGQTGQMVRAYQDRFRKERFDKLFSLRPGHLRFQCEEKLMENENDNQLTTMKIKVYKGEWDEQLLKTLLSYVSQQWNSPSYHLEFQVVNQKEVSGESVIQIIPTQNFNSYVPDNNTRVVYLSEKLDLLTKQKVLAHEFGHVLGFPDCYVEYFDEKEKELVYYEQAKTDTNLMCSLKNGVRAPDDYLKQLREKSCLFP